MNLASWIILGIVVAIAALALRSTLKGRKSSCCGSSCAGQDAGRDYERVFGEQPGLDSCCTSEAGAGGLQCEGFGAEGSAGCSKSCATCPASKYVLQPRIIPVIDEETTS